MELELVSFLFSWFLHIDPTCIVCNWHEGIGAVYFGLGGLGAAAGGFFGGSGGYSSPGADDGGAGQTLENDRLRDPATMDQRARRAATAFSEGVTRVVFGDQFLEPTQTLGPSRGGPVMHYDADYVGRDYENDPVVPPAPRDS